MDGRHILLICFSCSNQNSGWQVAYGDLILFGWRHCTVCVENGSQGHQVQDCYLHRIETRGTVMRTWETRPELGLRDRDCQTRPGLQIQGPVPVLQASAKQLGRCPADLTPPQGSYCRTPVTRAAQIEVSSPESRCSPIFCMRWCRVGIQPVDKWLRFRLLFGWVKNTVVHACVCVCVFILSDGECEFVLYCTEHCSFSDHFYWIMYCLQ